MSDKPLIWLGSSRSRLRKFPTEARQEAGFQLRRLQQGLLPSDWRPMKEIGPGVAEIRIHARGEYRVFYVTRFSDALYVLHAFHKQTQQTPRREIEIAERQYAQLRRFRKKREDS